MQAPSPKTQATAGRWLTGAGAVYLVYALAAFVRASLHWPLVGDATLLHYCVLMLRHGFAPYRQLIDINLPGTYFVEWAVIRLFGYGPLPWRLFDLLLLALIACASLAILAHGRGWRSAWFPALWVSSVFTLLHGRDGLPQLGQRDLLLTMLLAVAIACLLQVEQRQMRGAAALAAAVGCGLAIGAATTIKPLALLLLSALQLLPARRSACQGPAEDAASAKAALPALSLRAGLAWRASLPIATAAWLGALLPIAAACGYLLRSQALSAFAQTMTQLVPLHSSLFRLPPLRLLDSCISSVLLPVFLLGLPAALSARPWRSFPGRVLLAGIAFGVLSYVAQGRGYPYHRYPLHLCLLLLYARTLPDVLRGRFADVETARAATLISTLAPTRAPTRVRRSVLLQASALLALLAGIVVLVPRSLSAVERFTPGVDPFDHALAAELARQGGPALAGQVQCLDMAGGCATTLLRLQLPQSTGFLYDCYAVLPVAPAFAAEQQRYRAAWLAALAAHPPKLLIATSDECGPADQLYRKLTLWPALAGLLRMQYTLVAAWTPHTPERWTGQTATLPYGFRIYRRRD